MGVREVRVFETPSVVAREAGEFVSWVIEQATSARGTCRLVLSGGSTPRSLYTTLVRDYATMHDWSAVRFFFGDERCVPPDHPESNFKLADETLFRPLRLPPKSVFRMEGEAPNPEAAAARYDDLLGREVPSSGRSWPRFDLILLGLGDDGHTASLFPQSPALKERARRTIASQAPRGIRDRITLTVPVINHAETVVFLVTGSEKAPAVQRALEGSEEPDTCPAKLIAPVDGRVIWYLDDAAARGLTATAQQIAFDEE